MCRVMFFLSMHMQARQLRTTSSAKISVQAHCGMFSCSPACQTSTAPLGHSCPLGRWEPTSHALACTTHRAALWASIHTQTAFWLVTTKASHAAGESGRRACRTHPSHTQAFISRYAWIAAIKPLQSQRRVSSTNAALRSAVLYYFFVRVQHLRQLVLSALTVSLHVLAAADCSIQTTADSARNDWNAQGVFCGCSCAAGNINCPFAVELINTGVAVWVSNITLTGDVSCYHDKDFQLAPQNSWSQEKLVCTVGTRSLQPVHLTAFDLCKASPRQQSMLPNVPVASL